MHGRILRTFINIFNITVPPYKKKEDNTWDAIMYGSSGDIFYEHNVGEKE